MLLQPVTQMIDHCLVIKTFEMKSEKMIEHSLANKKIVNDKIGTFAMERFMHDLRRRNYCMTPSISIVSSSDICV